MTAYEGPTHGLASTYRKMEYRCRCEACTEAHRELQAAEVAGRRARLEADPSIVEHGRVSTYSNWGCRCRPCTDAMVEKVRRHARGS